MGKSLFILDGESGDLYKDDAVFATARNSASCDSVRKVSVITPSGAYSDYGASYVVSRYVAYFNTAALSDKGAVTSANIYQGYNYVYTVDAGYYDIYCVPNTASYPLVASDFGALLTSTDDLGHCVMDSLPSQYWKIALNPAGLAQINDGGMTGLALRLSGDISGGTPTGRNGWGGLETYYLGRENGMWMSPQPPTDVTTQSAILTSKLSWVDGDRYIPQMVLEVDHAGPNPEYPRYRFRYSTSPITSPTSGTATAWQYGKSPIETVTQEITGLEINTTYYYTAQAQFYEGGAESYFTGYSFNTLGYFEYPTDALTRVTGITHIYDRSKGIYRMNVYFGGLSNFPMSYSEANPDIAQSEQYSKLEQPDQLSKTDPTLYYDDWNYPVDEPPPPIYPNPAPHP